MDILNIIWRYLRCLLRTLTGGNCRQTRKDYYTDYVSLKSDYDRLQELQRTSEDEFSRWKAEQQSHVNKLTSERSALENKLLMKEVDLDNKTSELLMLQQKLNDLETQLKEARMSAYSVRNEGHMMMDQAKHDQTKEMERLREQFDSKLRSKDSALRKARDIAFQINKDCENQMMKLLEEITAMHHNFMKEKDYLYSQYGSSGDASERIKEFFSSAEKRQKAMSDLVHNLAEQGRARVNTIIDEVD